MKRQVYYKGEFKTYSNYPWEKQEAEIFVSLVVPAFNEEKRLGKMIDPTIKVI